MIVSILKFLSAQPPRDASIAIVDVAGQPIVAELAAHLHTSGYEISYVHCPLNSGLQPDDIARLRDLGLTIHEVLTGKSRGSKGRPMGRRAEIRYGLALSHRLRAGTVIACGLPLRSARILRVATQYRNGRYLSWLQGNEPRTADWQSPSRAERSGLHLADHVICASDEILQGVRRLGRQGSTALLPSWGPVDRIKVGLRGNDWAAERGLHDDLHRVVYAGTLGPQNRCGDIGRAVKELLLYNRFEFVFAAEGEGYQELQYDLALSNCERVHFVGRPDRDNLAQVLASADILLASLDPTVTELAASPEVLTYLCANRPILALAERDSLSSRIIRKAGAGRIVSSADQLGNAIFKLLNEPADALLEAKSGRHFAERFFAPEVMVPRFVAAAQLVQVNKSQPGLKAAEGAA